jgi:HPt (histidine-containing phosphotransfer) domain-containing protein
MVQAKDESPSVATFADHEVITPPHKLRKAVRQALPGEEDPVARAEAALAQLEGEFSDWMHAECERLDTARHDIHAHGFTAKTHEAVFHAAHDIKGEAATFGYPAVAGVADSLCRLIEHSPDIARIPLALIDQHVDAVRAIVREHGRADNEQMTAELTLRLREVTDEFLLHENRHRPDYLDGIIAVAPPLAPSNPGE